MLISVILRAKPNEIRNGLDIPFGNNPIQINMKILVLNNSSSKLNLLLLLKLFQILVIINLELINNTSLFNF